MRAWTRLEQCLTYSKCSVMGLLFLVPPRKLVTQSGQFCFPFNRWTHWAYFCSVTIMASHPRSPGPWQDDPGSRAAPSLIRSSCWRSFRSGDVGGALPREAPAATLRESVWSRAEERPSYGSHWVFLGVSCSSLAQAGNSTRFIRAVSLVGSEPLWAP